MKKLSQIKYPRFLLLLLTFALAYFIFKERSFDPLHDALTSLGYIGTFLTGIFFVYGFTAAPATAILLILAKEQDIFLTGLVAGLGALAGDLFIFKFIRYSFADEIKKIRKEKIFNFVKGRIPRFIRVYLAPVFAGFIIASPLPDEIGVALLAGTTKVSTKAFLIISYVLNTGGIFVILMIGRGL